MDVVALLRQVLQRRFLLPALCCCCLAAVAVAKHQSPPLSDAKVPSTTRPDNTADEFESEAPDSQTGPVPLNLSEFLYQPNSQAPVLKAITGRQVFDGLPFQIDGQVRVYGQTPEAHADGVYPVSLKGIRIGRKFDTIYLIHHATWPDVEGATIAYIVLNYADGTEYIFPIRYGVHVRDWFNLPSYEKEAVSDPDTKICWRRSPAKYKAPVRLFESKFENPSPDKVVTTMDIVSARHLSAYNLIAATVTNHRAAAAMAYPRERKFDGKMAIRVVDAVTGRPVAGALVLPGMDVLDEGVVGSPFRTSAEGEGTIPYPTKDTTEIFATVEKAGYGSESMNWSREFPATFTFRLKPAGTESR